MCLYICLYVCIFGFKGRTISKILPKPSQNLPRRVEQLPKSTPNPPKIDPEGLFEPILGPCLKKLDFGRQKNGQEAPKSVQERFQGFRTHSC